MSYNTTKLKRIIRGWVIMATKRTKLVRLYTDDVEEVKSRYPNAHISYMFHVSIRTNPFIQYDAFIKKIKQKRNR